MTKFKYKVISIDFANSIVTVKYWCEGMTSYNGFLENIPFDNGVQFMTEKEFDLKVYDQVKDNFKKVCIIYENYKSGNYDILEKIAKNVRSIDVM